MKKAFIIVGHSNWGKSKTLKSLTNDSVRVANFEIGEVIFFIRRMSNDDNEEGLLNFVNKRLHNKENIIITFCPVFDDERRSEEILQKLKQQGYNLYFFVLQYKFGSKENVITADQIEVMKGYGDVLLYDNPKESEFRANDFRQFVLQNI